MSSYATTDNLKAWLGSQVSATQPAVYQQITDRIASSTGSDTVGQELLDQAEAMINSYFVAKNLSIPISTAEAPVAAILRRLTLQIAGHTAFTTHPHIKEIPDRIQDAYDEAMDWLDKFIKGQVYLPATSPLATTETTGVTARAGGWTRRCTETDLKAL